MLETTQMACTTQTRCDVTIRYIFFVFLFLSRCYLVYTLACHSCATSMHTHTHSLFHFGRDIAVGRADGGGGGSACRHFRITL